jgi:lipopolysaccharide transport system ATP-binding protein
VPGPDGDVAREGRTVLFVSHNLAANCRHCPRSLLLADGRIAGDGPSGAVITQYLAALQPALTTRSWDDPVGAPGDEYLRLLSVSLLGADGGEAGALTQDVGLIVRIVYRVLQTMPSASVGFELRPETGPVAFTTYDADNPEWAGQGRTPGLYEGLCSLPPDLLNQGAYLLGVVAGIPHQRVCRRVEDVLRVDVGPRARGEDVVSRMGAPRPGFLAIDLPGAHGGSSRFLASQRCRDLLAAHRPGRRPPGPAARLGPDCRDPRFSPDSCSSPASP